MVPTRADRVASVDRGVRPRALCRPGAQASGIPHPRLERRVEGQRFARPGCSLARAPVGVEVARYRGP
eukprot:5272486-Pleurochrysis_carterae.AAC.1